MNSGHRPLPASMPFQAKASIMVQRGEARDFSEACSKLRHRPKYGRTTVTGPERRAAFQNVEKPTPKLWYQND